MKLEIKQIADSMNRAYFKQNLEYKSVELFKNNFVSLFEKIDILESEEHNKNIVANFLRDTYYKNKYEINTAGRKDLVIHKGKSNKTAVAVILEIKKPSNKQEMMSKSRPNTKALHETIHYYLKERLSGNSEIKHIIISNIYEWFIFDAAEFEKYFYLNKKFKTQYQNWTQGQLAGKTTDWFYKEIAKPFVEKNIDNLTCNYVNLHDYTDILSSKSQLNDSKIINLYKIFSPEYLLKLPFGNDYNKIDTKFYHELLYIFGLEEVESGGSKIITRVNVKDRQSGSILEDVINTLIVKKKLKNVSDLAIFGEDEEEQIFSIALELCITWLNRILFLKLLEGQLIRYHKDTQDFAFINAKKIKYFEELDELFFEVLAIKVENRSQSIHERFGNLPYLNSSLFEQTKLEKETIQIADLKNRIQLSLYKESVLKQKSFAKNNQKPNTLVYFLDFLSAYNFASDPKAEIQNDTKTLINSAVLGLIFEKINGYKEGSFYTPSFITKYMSSESLKKIVVEKFSKNYGKAFENFEEVKKFIDYTDEKERQKANQIINSIKICDPAVGSGHFLVSMLNELIALKSDLRILQDVDKNRIRGIKINNVNDELEIINYETSEPFQYYLYKKGSPHPEIQNLQKALFYEKQTLIESCIFGVDINQKSVSICRLRLWIELLKNTFYTEESNYTHLETLPNIDINIKQGNSLISFFDFNGNSLKNGRFQKLHKFTKEYKIQVDLYKNIKDAAAKEQILNKIEVVKEGFLDFVNPRDKDFVELKKKEAKLTEQFIFFSREEQEEWKIKHAKLKAEVAQEQHRLEEKKRTIYKQAFEWRFEFPEVLSDTGEFEGFDMIVGNPPYISIQDIKWGFRRFYETIYKTANGRFDLYSLFIERAKQILKPKGIFSFIVPAKFLNNKQFIASRKLMISDKQNIKIVYIHDKIFDKAQVNSAIVEVSYTDNEQIYKSVTCKNEKFKVKSQIPLSLINETKECIFKIEIDTETDKLLQKIQKNTLALKEIAEVRDGMVAGEIKDILYLKRRTSRKYCKKLYFGRHLSKYHVKDTAIWVNYQPKKMMKEEVKRKKGKRSGLWMRDEKIFNREKILTRFVAKEVIACYDNQNKYYEHTLHSTHVTNKKFKTKYILALFNSSLFKFYYQKSNSMSGNLFPQVRISSLKSLPIKETDLDTQDKLIKIVDEIMELKSEKLATDTSYLEKEIDKLIYQLYDLTEEQIMLIEKK